MSLGKQLFRESALQRLQSPEQLDQVLQVTSPKGWLAIGAIWSLIAVVVLWAIAGNVPTKEHGRGIMIPRESLKPVQASGTGRLDEILFEVGDLVGAGTVVARVDKADLSDQIEDLQSQLAQLQERHRTLDDLDEQQATLERELADKERKRLTDYVGFLTARIEEVRTTELDKYLEALERGAANELEVFRVKERIELKRSELAQAQLRLQEVDADLRTAEMDRLTRRTGRDLEEHKLSGQIDVLSRQYERESKVRCETGGRVAELRVAEDTRVESGDTIMLVEPIDVIADAGDASGSGDEAEIECPCRTKQYAQLEAVVYVSAATGQDRIQPGQTVHVSPSTVKREEHGSILGVVSEIRDYTTSIPAMMRVLNDRTLVDEFRLAVGVPLEMRVRLCRDDENVSGLEWTSAKGPPSEISAGTICEASVTVESRRPIELVIPKIKETLGVE